MAVRRSAGVRAARAKGMKNRAGKVGRAKDDGLTTTPTQYGERSPDYVKQAGDPKWLRSYSEEQIGMMGGRDRVIMLANESQRRAAERAQASTNVETGIESGGTTPGPTTPPSTYGTDPFSEYGLPGGLPNEDGTMSTADMTEPGGGVATEMPKPGKATAPGQQKKKVGPKPGSPAAKKKFLKRVARTTGTTTGEAKGIMRKARTQVRRGNKVGARRTITRALSGGPRAGVSRSPARSRKAAVAAKKVTKRIATRQAQATPARKRKK